MFVDEYSRKKEIQSTVAKAALEREKERGTGILFKEPNATGSRLFNRETEHLCLRQPIHGLV